MRRVQRDDWICDRGSGIGGVVHSKPSGLVQGKLPLIQLHMILRCVFSSQYDLEAWPSPLSYRPTDVSSGVKTTRSVSNVPNALGACPHDCC